MRANMKETEKAIANEFQRIAQGYRSDAEVAKSKEGSLTREMETLAGRSVDAQKTRVEMAQLDSVAQSFQAIRDNFLSRFAELSQEQSFPITEARVLNKATVPQKAYAPRASLAFAGGAGLGVMAGFLLALCAEIFSRRARMRESVETVTGAPCLAWLPHLDKSKDNGELPADMRAPLFRDPSRAPRSAFVAARGRAIGLLERLREKVSHWSSALAPPSSEVAPKDHFEAVADAPFGIFAEGLRSIKIAVNARFEGQRGVVLAFVSARPGEGSSTVAANFASLAAGAGQRTILMDVDLRRRTLSRRIAPAAEMGLQSVYRDLSRLLKAFSLFRGGVHFLPAVEGGSDIHPSELIASPEMRQLTDLLRRTFDLIVLDLPPAIATIDGRAIADLVDAYVLVVEWNRTTLETLGEAMAENPQIARKLVGFAFNKVDIEEAKRIGDYAAVIDREYRERGSRPAVLGDAAARTA